MFWRFGGKIIGKNRAISTDGGNRVIALTITPVQCGLLLHVEQGCF